jgi:hypothetical protein
MKLGPPQMSPLTVLLGKIVGLTYLITCLVCLIRPKTVFEASKSIAEDPGLLLVSGTFTMAGGVATVVGHNVWSGGVLPVSVTVLGWMMLAKGLALMATPPEMLAASYGFLSTPQRFRLVMIPATLFAAWVTALAFTA